MSTWQCQWDAKIPDQKVYSTWHALEKQMFVVMEEADKAVPISFTCGGVNLNIRYTVNFWPSFGHIFGLNLCGSFKIFSIYVTASLQTNQLVYKLTS